MEMNLSEKSKPLVLKLVAKIAKASQVWGSEETSHAEGFEDDSDDKEMAFVNKRF